MSSNPLNRDYQVPGPIPQPILTKELISSSGQPLGQRLFDDTTEFYSWYVSSWYMSDGGAASAEILQKSESTRKILSLLKRIAEVSMNGGNFLTEKEEVHALNDLSNILQDLNSGKLRKQHLPDALFQVMEDLIQNNPKAKVVSQVTELEYYLCINPPAGQSLESTIQYQKVLNRVTERISPQMRDINASAIAQGLSQILENPSGVENIYQAIQEAIKHWL
jgi:hypothetical protein